MQHTPNPVLNDEEVSLLNRPEECLRHAVGRAALSLDEVISELPAHVAAAVLGIVTGERPAIPLSTPSPLEAHQPISSGRPGLARDSQDYEQALAHAHFWLSRFYPHLDSLLDEGVLTPYEGMAAAHSVDAALGRYPTGARYAAP